MAPPQKRKRTDFDRTIDLERNHNGGSSKRSDFDRTINTKGNRDGSTKKHTSRGKTSTNADAVDTSRPSAIYKPTKGREYTVSIAVADSVISNALTHDLKTALAGTLSRALAVFCIDELVIFSDGSTPPKTHTQRTSSSSYPSSSTNTTHDADLASGYTAFADPAHFLHHLTSYLETPPHLRKALFGFHPDLRTAGSLPSLDIPSHLRTEEWCSYREGVTVPAPKGKKGTFVNAGLPVLVELTNPPEGGIPLNTRVTLKFDQDEPPKTWEELKAEAVGPEVPREEGGYYWGYSTRKAKGIMEVFTECAFEGGYDYSIGMSERGEPVSEVMKLFSEGTAAANGDHDEEGGQSQRGAWKHLLIVFGGPPGLEVAVQNDEELKKSGVTKASDLFDAWVKLIPGQGSRTIRTEEAVWIGLTDCWELVKMREAFTPEMKADKVSR